MNPTEKRKLGRTDVELTQFGFGGAPIGELFVRVSDEDAQATQQAAWDHGVRYFDTSPWYGLGLSEHRVGRFLAQQRRDDFIISTKVGRLLRPPSDPAVLEDSPWIGGLPFEPVFDYGYDAIMRSFEDSLQRLGLNRIDLLVIHDLDFLYHQTEALLGAHLGRLATSGWRALDDLRSAGVIGGVGVGINQGGMIPRFLDLVDLDFFLVAIPYTLMEQEVLDDEFPRCQERDVGIVIGAVFSSGILVTGAVEGAKHNYADATPEDLEKVRRMKAVCKSHGVALPAAALQFPFGHPCVASVIPGAFQPEHVEQNSAHFQHDIPSDLWEELKAENLIRPDAPTP